MEDFVDFRSDTVTKPTPEMRQAMANAVVGDDVYCDDPTTIELQDYAAQLLGKEAALFVPSGCFGNQSCIYTHLRRGEELILANECHIVQYEAGAASIISGAQLRCIDTTNTNGFLTPEQVENLIRKSEGVVFPKTGLISVEQPTSQGKVYPLEALKQIYEVAKKYNIKLHMDGARIFNAATYLKCDPKEIAQYCDSIMLCLSKGLCAPVGSLILGTKEFIATATKTRKMMGGGLRQSGVLAAPGLLALKEQTKHLGKDLEVIIHLAKKLKTLPSIEIDDSNIQINMIFFKINNEAVKSSEFVEYLLQNKIKMGGSSGGYYRLMTHFYTREKEVDYFFDILKAYLDKHSS